MKALLTKLILSKFTQKLFLKILKVYVKSSKTKVDDNVYSMIVKLLKKDASIEKELSQLWEIIKK